MSKRALDEYHADIKAFGGSSTFRGIARLALTCFVKPMEQQKDIIQDLCDYFDVTKLSCSEPNCTKVEFFTQRTNFITTNDHETKLYQCEECDDIYCTRHMNEKTCICRYCE